ncbi:MAG: urea ABC transporter ATP-binding protein UrtD [Pirellulales bacterium]|nr:urea ABC transporter ATP-binding protein UrtD [Pirellulales bacterium]
MSGPRAVFCRPNELSRDSRLSSFLIYLEGVTVVFDGFKALDIDLFGIHYNELRVVIGPNGAGKTTMCDVISGKTRVTDGKLFWQGNEISNAHDIAMSRLGVGRKFQTPSVFDSLTVFENLELALPNRQTDFFRNLWGKTTSDEEDKIHQMMGRVHLTHQADVQASLLSHGQRQCLEIIMLVLAEPDLLLVDEPAAGLSDEETSLMAELLLELRGQHSIIVIEHDMDFVRRLDAGVTVLNEGQIMAEGYMKEIQANPEVIEAYLGR